MDAPFKNNTQTVPSTNKSHLFWLWEVIGAIIIAALASGITYAIVHKNNPTASTTASTPTERITADLTSNKAGAALKLFKAQPAAYQSTQTSQLQLVGIYMENKDFSSALQTAQKAGAKWGWNFNLSEQAAQAALLSDSSSSVSTAIQYYQQSINLLQTQITQLKTTPIATTPAKS